MGTLGARVAAPEPACRASSFTSPALQRWKKGFGVAVVLQTTRNECDICSVLKYACPAELERCVSRC